MPITTTARDADESRRILETPGGIKYALSEGPSFSDVVHGASTAKAVYIVRARRLMKFCEEIMPTPRRKNGVVYLKEFVSLNVPSHYTAVSIQVDPINNDRPFDPFITDKRDSLREDVTYEFESKVTVDYATNIDGYWDGDRDSSDPKKIVEPSLEATAEVISIPANKAVVTQDSPGDTPTPFTDPTAPITRLCPIIMHSLRWSWALYPDFHVIFALLGKLNNQVYDWIPGDNPAESVLFTAVSGKREFRHSQLREPLAPWVLDYKLAQRIVPELRDIGWNHVWTPKDQQWHRLKLKNADGSFRSLYEQADLKNIFSCELTEEEIRSARAAADAEAEE